MYIPVFLTSDNNYAAYLAVTMSSILLNTKQNIDFYILDCGISEENKIKLLEQNNKFTNCSTEFLKINLSDFNIHKVPLNLTKSTYARLLIPILKPKLEKIIYLDTDIIAFEDIYNLYKTDMSDFIIAACCNNTTMLWEKNTHKLLELSSEHKIFNAGVLLIDIKKWLKNDVNNNLIKIQNEYNNRILHADESLLNKYFDNNYKSLDIQWNCTDYDFIISPEIKLSLRHFASGYKPWKDKFCIVNDKKSEIKNFDDFWNYAKETQFYDEIKKEYDKNNMT